MVWFNKPIGLVKIVCLVPDEIVEAAKNLDQNLKEMIEMALILWKDGNIEIKCPYYNVKEFSDPKEYGCYPSINLSKKLEENPGNLQKLLSVPFGCICQYDKCKS